MLHVVKSHGFTKLEFKCPLVYLKMVLNSKGSDTGDYMTKTSRMSPLRIN